MLLICIYVQCAKRNNCLHASFQLSEILSIKVVSISSVLTDILVGSSSDKDSSLRQISFCTGSGGIY